MAVKDVENAEKTLAYFLAARRKAALQLATQYEQGMSRITDANLAESFDKLQRGVEAARAALEEEQTNADYLGELNEQLLNE